MKTGLANEYGMELWKIQELELLRQLDVIIKQWHLDDLSVSRSKAEKFVTGLHFEEGMK